MTSAVDKAIADSRERQRALEKKWPSSYSDGLETEAARFRDALEIAVKALPACDHSFSCQRCNALARIEAIIRGEK